MYKLQAGVRQGCGGGGGEVVHMKLWEFKLHRSNTAMVEMDNKV